MTKKLAIGLVGLSLMGQIRASNIARLPNARLHAVASRRQDMAQNIAQRYHANRFYTDYAQLFSDPDLDAVIISSAITEHVDHIIQATVCRLNLSNCSGATHFVSADVAKINGKSALHLSG